MEFVKPLDPYSLAEVDEPYRDRTDGQKGHGIQARSISDPMKEITHVIDYFLGDGSDGSGQDPVDLQQLRKAIQLAGGVANNPVYPEIETASGKLAIGDNNDGTLFIGAGQTWLWRGLTRFSSSVFDVVDRTVTMVANKTYHVRWYAPGTGIAIPVETYPYGRIELVDMTAASPTEGNSTYDTSYDNMLIARIVTDGANVAAITTFINRASLSFSANLAMVPAYIGSTAWRADFSADLNWSRAPKVWSFSGAVYCNAPGSGNYVLGGANIPNGIAIWRYGWGVSFTTDWLNTSSTGLNAYCIAGLKGE